MIVLISCISKEGYGYVNEHERLFNIKRRHQLK